MAEAKKKLGRGLSSLLSPTSLETTSTNTKPLNLDVPTPDSNHANAESTVTGVAAIHDILLEKIVKNPHQPRQQWDEEKLTELAESIRVNGLIQPIVVRQVGEAYQLIAGERRLKAMKIAGKKTAPAIVRDANEEQMLQWSIIENIHRADLNPLERAQAYQNYIQRFNITQQEAADRLGENRSSMANYMRLLELPSTIKNYINEGKLSMGHARALLGIKDVNVREDLANMTLLRQWSVRDLEKEIQRISNRSIRQQEKQEFSHQAHFNELETEFTRSIGSRVIIKPKGRKGYRGKIIIEYNSLDDFDRIQSLLVNS